MKKNVIIIFFILIIIAIFFFIPKNSPEVKTSVFEEKSERPLSRPIPKASHHSTAPVIQRVPAANSLTSRVERRQLKKIGPDDLELQYQLIENMYLVKDITPIPLDRLKEAQGEVIYSDFNFHYVHSSDSPNTQLLSIYDAETERLRTISPIIQIRNVNESKRNEIISRGFQEHLYLENVKTLYIQTNGTDYSIVFDNLKKEGFTPQYQEIKRLFNSK